MMGLSANALDSLCLWTEVALTCSKLNPMHSSPSAGVRLQDILLQVFGAASCKRCFGEQLKCCSAAMVAAVASRDNALRDLTLHENKMDKANFISYDALSALLSGLTAAAAHHRTC